MKSYTRRRHGGNVGPDAVGIQARWKEWETRSVFLSFPRFPRRGISTARPSPSSLAPSVWREHRRRVPTFLLRVQRRGRNISSQEVKQ